MRTRKNIFLWLLYDFANSVIMITFFLYFAQWVVIEKNVPDFYFNLTFSIAALLLFLSVPFTGVMLDKAWRRISGLRYTTILAFIFYFSSAVYAISDRWFLSLIFFTLGLYFYLLSFTFYTPLLNDITSDKKRGLVSGLGIAANYLGQIFGLVVALPFSLGLISLFGASPRAETLMPATLIFLILSLPMLILFKEPKKRYTKLSMTEELRDTFKESKILFGSSGVFLFIISYFLFNDAILTAANNFPLFLEQVWHVSDTIKTYILIGIMITSAMGGVLSGLVADKFGHKRTLMFILAGWVIILPLLGILTNFTLFVLTTTLMGFWFGANWTVSRSVMSYLAPKGKHNLAFAFYGLAERASSLLGPIVWGAIVSGLVSIGEVRYRIAIVTISLFIVVGLIVLYYVRSDRE